jgi:hypothetical protein
MFRGMRRGPVAVALLAVLVAGCSRQEQAEPTPAVSSPEMSITYLPSCQMVRDVLVPVLQAKDLAVIPDWSDLPNETCTFVARSAPHKELARLKAGTQGEQQLKAYRQQLEAQGPGLAVVPMTKQQLPPGIEAGYFFGATREAAQPGFSLLHASMVASLSVMGFASLPAAKQQQLVSALASEMTEPSTRRCAQASGC